MNVVDNPSLRFPADTSHLASVRDFACQEAAGLDPAANIDLIALVVGELAANAAVHQHGEARLDLIRRPDGCIEVSVTDPDPGQPKLVEEAPWSSSGHRGMQLIAALADDWGIETLDDGKRVWARLGPA